MNIDAIIYTLEMKAAHFLSGENYEIIIPIILHENEIIMRYINIKQKYYNAMKSNFTDNPAQMAAAGIQKIN